MSRSFPIRDLIGICKICSIKFPYKYKAGIKKEYCSELCTMKKNYERHVVRTDSGCWKWSGILNIHGYGVVRTGTVNGKVKYITAHRASWIIHNSSIPEKMHILHKCDTPSCTSPKCLFFGTHQDNMKDRNKKGRVRGEWKKGREGPNKKFTKEQELEAFLLFGKNTLKEIAIKLNLHPSTIGRFKRKYNQEKK